MNIYLKFLLISIVYANADDTYYNVLSIDGGGIRGIIPA